MTFSVVLTNYLAPCTILDTKDCHESISFEYSEEHLKHHSGSQMQLSCKLLGEQLCEIVLSCADCEVTGTASLLFKFSHELSYSSKITANVTTFSSIPSEHSTTTQSVYPDADTIFRGSPGSIFFFVMTPSLYRNTDSGEEDTGYHVYTVKSPTKGASYQTYEIPFTDGLAIEIQVQSSENSLVTLRSQKQSLMLLGTALLGSVFGLMGAVGGGMKVLEGRYKKMQMARSLKQDEKRLEEKRRMHQLFLRNAPIATKRPKNRDGTKSTTGLGKTSEDSNESV